MTGEAGRAGAGPGPRPAAAGGPGDRDPGPGGLTEEPGMYVPDCFAMNDLDAVAAFVARSGAADLVTGPGGWAGMSGRGWPGWGGRAPGWRWGVMSSSAAWPSGSRDAMGRWRWPRWSPPRGTAAPPRCRRRPP